MAESLVQTLDTTIESDIAALAQLVNEAAEAAAAAVLPAEPDLPASRNRMMTEPMTRAGWAFCRSTAVALASVDRRSLLARLSVRLRIGPVDC